MENKSIKLPTAGIDNLFSAFDLLMDLCKDGLLKSEKSKRNKEVFFTVLNDLEDKVKNSFIEISLTEDQQELLNSLTDSIDKKQLPLSKKEKMILQYFRNKMCNSIEQV